MKQKQAIDHFRSLLQNACNKKLNENAYLGASYYKLILGADKLILSDKEANEILSIKTGNELMNKANDSKSIIGQLFVRLSEHIKGDAYISSLSDTFSNSETIKTKKEDEPRKISTEGVPTPDELVKKNFETPDLEGLSSLTEYRELQGKEWSILDSEYIDRPYNKISKLEYLLKNAPKLFAIKYAQEFGKVWNKKGTEAEQLDAVYLYLGWRDYDRLMKEGVPDWMLKKYKKVVEDDVKVKFKAKQYKK